MSTSQVQSAKGRRTKGNNFESKIAKLLTAWSGVKFNRSPSSGAWGSTHGVYSNIAGDIITEHPDWNYSLELKNHESWELQYIPLSQGEIPSFWEQALGDAIRTERVPMVVLHKNRSKNWAIVPQSNKLQLKLSKAGKPFFSSELRYHRDREDDDKVYPILTFILEDLLEVFTFEDLIEETPELFKVWLKQYDND